MSDSRARALGMTADTWSYEKAYSRNLGLIDHEEQKILRSATVGIPGLGGVGGIHLVTLARLGIGGFKIADRDEYSIANINRQFGAFSSSNGRSKVEVMSEFLYDINPEVRLEAMDEFIDGNNIHSFLDGVDIVVDSLDAFSIDVRLLLFRECQKRQIPVVSAGPIGFSTAMLVMTPSSMSLDDYLNIHSTMTQHQKFVRFIAGLTPKPLFTKYMNTTKVDHDSKNGPSLASSVSLCAGFAAVEIIKIILKRGRVNSLPYYHYYDSYLNKFIIGKLRGGNRNPIQKIKIWYLEKYVLKDFSK